MLSAPFIDGSPYLFYVKSICHLYSLLAAIRTIVNSILPGWTTRIAMFFFIAVAGIRSLMLSVLKKMTLYPVSFHRASMPTEVNLPHELKEDYPNGNMILREDYQKAFKKEVRWTDIKSFLRAESIGEVYRSYNNGEKDRYVCLSSQQNGIHDVFDRLK